MIKRDTDIHEEFDDKNENAAVYGNVNLSKEAKSAATLPPAQDNGMMVYQKSVTLEMSVISVGRPGPGPDQFVIFVTKSVVFLKGFSNE